MSDKKCPYCSQDEFVADRMGIWNTARARLKSEDWDTEAISPADVLMLAIFLAGETSQ